MWIYEPDALKARCRGCAATIQWAVTDRLAKVPLDQGWLITGERVDQNGVPQIEVKVSFSHFTTCPMRDRFAKKAA